MRPRLLDLFCCQGGAAMGYARAGFDVVGVDIVPQPRYPFTFIQADALEYLAEHGAEYDAIHASPPCQGYSVATLGNPGARARHPRLIGKTRCALRATGLPYVIENVTGAKTTLASPLLLCGSMFGLTATDIDGTPLRLERHRWFESNIFMMSPADCWHDPAVQVGGVYGGGAHDRRRAKDVRRGGYTPVTSVRAELMGIDWMTGGGLTEAIPPAYCQFIGEQILDALGHGVERLRRDSSRAHTRDNDAFPGRRTDFHPSTDVLSGNESFARSLQSRFVASEGYLSELSRGQDAQD